jgi:hypothetical protein
MGNDFHHTGCDGELTRTNAWLYEAKDSMRSPLNYLNKEIYGND